MKLWIIGCTVLFFFVLFPALALVVIVLTVMAMASKG